MAQVDEGTLTAIGAALAKLAPGILGSLISLRALPVGATWGDRFTAFVGGVGASMYVGPALTEWAGISSARIEAGIGFAVGLFGMVVVGELVSTFRELGLAQILRDWLRKILGVAR